MVLGLLDEFSYSLSSPTLIYGDNTSAISIASSWCFMKERKALKFISRRTRLFFG